MREKKKKEDSIKNQTFVSPFQTMRLRTGTD